MKDIKIGKNKYNFSFVDSLTKKTNSVIWTVSLFNRIYGKYGPHNDIGTGFGIAYLPL